jgi:uncharacterized membrane protein YphA (DoxX/SURF4 family)
MTNPITDAFSFLTANTGDFNTLGLWKYLILLLFYALLAGSLWLVVDNWRDDPAQRTGTALWFWLSRLLIGCMWFQGTLWKLPFGHQNGLWYWTQQMAGRAAFEAHRAFVTDVILPNFNIVNPLVYFAELGFAIALMLGLFVRIAGLAAALFTVNLWLGIYNQRPGDPEEWPWSYMFLILLCGALAVLGAGRFLGADAWLRRKVAAVHDRRGLGALIRFLT